MDVIDVIFILAHTIISLAGVFFNLLLIYVAVFHSPNKIRTYASLIINFAITDLIICILDFFVQQRAIPSGWSVIFIGNGPCKFFGHTACSVANCFQQHLLTFGVYSLLLSFCYRFYIVSNPTPNRRAVLKILGIVYIPSFVQLIFSLLMGSPPDVMKRIFEEAFSQYDTEDLLINGVEDVRKFFPAVAISHAILIVPPVYAIIFVLRKIIINKLDFSNVMSSIAIITYAIGQLRFLNHPALEYASPISLVLPPVLSPLASLYFVQAYKKKVRKVPQSFSTPFMDLLDTSFISAHIALSLAGMLFNALLIYVGIFHSPNRIRTYATLIINFAITDFIICSVDLFVQQRNNFEHHLLTFGVYCLLLSFCYRYYIITRSPPKRRPVLFCLGLFYIPSFIQLIASLIMGSPPEEMKRILEQDFPHYSTENMAISGVADTRELYASMAISHSTMCVLPIYAVIFFVRRKIINSLNLTMSALSVQTCLPMFSSIAIVCYSMGQLRIYNNRVLEYISPISLLLTPVTSPLAALFFVHAYKHKVLSLFPKKTDSISQVTPNISLITPAS
ncbi:unnamed protein product [Caenorhabditis auriculariae]|uniref:G-protein coupled receptors family 1 profile domain-containing protein n=1 Tax=Caenorhabditis auriculariae TaxID=2777116 RepID=A0A8S1HIX2_9PELO|nr:unnamed protein product [Caenorhabditis auriculariae]